MINPIDNNSPLQINATQKGHINFNQTQNTQNSKFSSMLFDTLNEVNDSQNKPTELGLMAQLDPESVNPHDISIAILKSQMEIHTLKQVAEKGIQAYKDIINIR